MKINSKTVGEMSEAVCMTELLKKNIPVSLPWGDNQPYDMIMDYNGKLYKLQCKTARTVIENETFLIPTCSIHSNMYNTYKSSYEGLIDFFISFYQNEIYLIPIEKATKSEFRMRLAPCKNNQTKGINFASDYKLEKQLDLLCVE